MGVSCVYAEKQSRERIISNASHYIDAIVFVLFVPCEVTADPDKNSQIVGNEITCFDF